MIDIKKINLKKEVETLKKMKGKERGADYKYLVNYIVSKKGVDGFERIKKELEKMNFHLPDIKNIDDMDWLPLNLNSIFVVAIVKIFSWQKKDIIEMGRSSAPSSPLLRFFVRHFLSPQKTIEKATGKAWKNYYSKGALKLIKYDKKNKEVVMRITGMDWHPFTCIYHIGSLSAIGEFVFGKKFKGQETECIYKGDKYHEFKFNWK